LQSARTTVRLLSKAQALGSPYFSQTNRFFNELVESLAGFEDLPEAERRRVMRIRGRWQRELSLQRSAGVSFSWLSRDQQLLKEGKLAPKRNPSGRLRPRDTALVFSGLIRDGVVTFQSGQSEAPKAAPEERRETSLKAGLKSAPYASSAATPTDAPALTRPAGPDDDPNKARFGEAAEAGGFKLSAQFAASRGGTTSITLTVEAVGASEPATGEFVWFCLHPTFNPEWIKILFRGRLATLTVQAWGGFTAGAWIPSRGVELECDLSQLPEAPRMIREL
jgi:hypothetical protein